MWFSFLCWCISLSFLNSLKINENLLTFVPRITLNGQFKPPPPPQYLAIDFITHSCDYITQFWLHNSQLRFYILQFWLFSQKKCQNCEISQNWECVSYNSFFSQLWFYTTHFLKKKSELQDVKSQLWVIKSELHDIKSQSRYKVTIVRHKLQLFITQFWLKKVRIARCKLAIARKKVRIASLYFTVRTSRLTIASLHHAILRKNQNCKM